MIEARHIQNFSEASAVEPHWGYADRVVPCTNDVGSCEYLDVVYSGHDRGMIYAGAMWSIIGAILLVFAVTRDWYFPSRYTRSLSAFSRRHLLPEFKSLRYFFGHTTRLQVIVLAATAAYLLVFSFAGMRYATWVTPVKKMPGVYNTRTTLGPWSDRVGLLAYALTPLSILLANRESLLSLCTGIPYHHFNFLHRWIGHIIFAQSILHTIGWCVIEIRLYQPQPNVAIAWIKQEYIIWGVVAMILLLALWILSTGWARRRFGYEFFRKAHWVLAMVYIGACWAHWKNLKCFMIPSLALWLVDRGARLVRTALIHYQVMPGGKGLFAAIDGHITQFERDVIRLDLDCPNPVEWTIGQHFFLTFSDGGIWQSHPFTPLGLPGRRQSYVFRAKSGETKRIANLETDTTKVILTGPYGEAISDKLQDDTNVLCIAGGTGICFVLPVLLDLARRSTHTAAVELFWVVRSARHAEWVAREIDILKETGFIKVTIHSTGSAGLSSYSTEDGEGLSTPGAEEVKEEKDSRPEVSGPSIGSGHRPDLREKVRAFVEGAKSASAGTTVFVSGPGGMTSDVRDAVAGCNSIRKAWQGDNSGEVELVYDERLE